MTVELGEVYRDPVSGFVGTATGRAVYLQQEGTQVRLTAHTGPTGDEKERWFPENRLASYSGSSLGFKPQ